MSKQKKAMDSRDTRERLRINVDNARYRHVADEQRTKETADAYTAAVVELVEFILERPVPAGRSLATLSADIYRERCLYTAATYIEEERARAERHGVRLHLPPLPTDDLKGVTAEGIRRYSRQITELLRVVAYGKKRCSAYVAKLPVDGGFRVITLADGVIDVTFRPGDTVEDTEEEEAHTKWTCKSTNDIVRRLVEATSDSRAAEIRGELVVSIEYRLRRAMRGPKASGQERKVSDRMAPIAELLRAESMMCRAAIEFLRDARMARNVGVRVDTPRWIEGLTVTEWDRYLSRIDTMRSRIATPGYEEEFVYENAVRRASVESTTSRATRSVTIAPWHAIVKATYADGESELVGEVGEFLPTRGIIAKDERPMAPPRIRSKRTLAVATRDPGHVARYLEAVRKSFEIITTTVNRRSQVAHKNPKLDRATSEKMDEIRPWIQLAEAAIFILQERELAKAAGIHIPTPEPLTELMHPLDVWLDFRDRVRKVLKYVHAVRASRKGKIYLGAELHVVTIPGTDDAKEVRMECDLTEFASDAAAKKLAKKNSPKMKPGPKVGYTPNRQTTRKTVPKDAPKPPAESSAGRWTRKSAIGLPSEPQVESAAEILSVAKMTDAEIEAQVAKKIDVDTCWREARRRKWKPAHMARVFG